MSIEEFDKREWSGSAWVTYKGQSCLIVSSDSDERLLAIYTHHSSSKRLCEPKWVRCENVELKTN